MSGDAGGEEILLGFVSGVHGVKGWVKIHSYTEPRVNVVAHRQWTLQLGAARRYVEVVTGREHGRTVIAQVAGVDDRDSAAELVGAKIFVPRASLPPCGPGEYYWADLEGMLVADRAGNALGRVDHLIATGAHDVLVLAGSPERLIPFVLDEVVTGVDLENRVITVRWDADYWEA